MHGGGHLLKISTQNFESGNRLTKAAFSLLVRFKKKKRRRIVESASKLIYINFYNLYSYINCLTTKTIFQQDRYSKCLKLSLESRTFRKHTRYFLLPY